MGRSPAIPAPPRAANRGAATVSETDIPDEEEIQQHADQAERDLKRWRAARAALASGMRAVSATQAPTVVDPHGSMAGTIAMAAQLRVVSDLVDKFAAMEERSAERMIEALTQHRPAPVDAEQVAMHKERMAFWRSRTVHVETNTLLLLGAALAVLGVSSMILGVACVALWLRLGGPAMVREAVGFDRVTHGAPP